MNKPHLVSTSAHLEDFNRIARYKDCYKLISNYKEFFQSISILETISKNKLDYLENTGFNVSYSSLENENCNKGVNWFKHLSYFLITSELKDDDIIVFITGRYNIINMNILHLIEKHMIEQKNQFIAKEDKDVYSDRSDGVHTFYMAFTKSKFLDLSNWFKINGLKNFSSVFEWDVKKYLVTHNECLVLPKNISLGVELQLSESIKHIC